ncbi:hypothetical protein FRC02_004002 [Tulasnella sp. 418]|nr:hypothetical protein FRC02_004002 [Tulasnella sp. 418]
MENNFGTSRIIDPVGADIMQRQLITGREESVSLSSKEESSPQVSSPPSTDMSTSSSHSAATCWPASNTIPTRKVSAWSQMKSLKVIHDPQYISRSISII